MNLPRLAAVLFAATFSATAAEKPVRLFILSGQSNMAGMKPEVGFVPEATALFPDAEVAFIKVAKGGMPIRDWVAEWDEIAKKHGIDPVAARGKGKPSAQPFYQQIIAQMKPLMEKHPQPASITFCWMQGENDARHKLDAAYADSMKQLVANLRRDLKRPDMNFVIGRISDFGKPDDPSWQAVRKAQVSVAESDPHGAWVDCDDLNDKPKGGKTVNDLHYTAAGYKLLGQRYARQAKALVDGKPVAKDGRP
jgi:Carbohydrate esterase, sialic acid-specific acetylesterase